MRVEPATLVGKRVHLELLELRHADALVAAAAGDHELYKWSPVPLDRDMAIRYIETALRWQDWPQVRERLSSRRDTIEAPLS